MVLEIPKCPIKPPPCASLMKISFKEQLRTHNMLIEKKAIKPIMFIYGKPLTSFENVFEFRITFIVNFDLFETQKLGLKTREKNIPA